MSETWATSTGHMASEAAWLDFHFESARAEYEEALRFLDIKPGWAVLDAGCGSGGYIPLMCEQVGATGRVAALDLAPENVAHVEELARERCCAVPVEARVGNVLDLPFGNATFDCVWCANVAAYLTTTEFTHAMDNFRRVTKPGGIITVKDLDVTILQFLPLPLDPSTPARILSDWCNPLRGPFFRQAGLENIMRKSWLVERWAPPPPATRHFVTIMLRFLAARSAESAIPQADREVLRAAAADPDRLLDDPDFCFREAFVVTRGQVPA